MGLEFPEQYKNWNQVNPYTLINGANINKRVDENKKDLEKNLTEYAK